MKKVIALFLTLILTISCGVTINSIVDSYAIKEPYKNPLIVIPYEEYKTKNFSEELKEKLEVEFKNATIKVEFLLVSQNSEKLTFNQNDDLNSKIENAIRSDQKDIVLIFKPTKHYYNNGGLQSATYKLTGIDAITKKEVWMAEFNSSSSFGPAFFAQKSAKMIFQKLKFDKVL